MEGFFIVAYGIIVIPLAVMDSVVSAISAYLKDAKPPHFDQFFQSALFLNEIERQEEIVADGPAIEDEVQIERSGQQALAPGVPSRPIDAYSVRPCSKVAACFSNSERSVFHAMPMPSTNAAKEGNPCLGAGGKYVPP